MDAEGADGAASTPVERDEFGQMDALLPDGRVQVVTVPDAWVDRSPAVLFPATLAAIEGLIRSSPKRPDEDGRGEVAVRTALGVDGEPLAEFCTCLLKHHLVESHRKLRPEIETPPQRPGGLLDRVATKLTAEMLGEEGYVEKLARWLVMSASGWSGADREADKDKVARRLLYLIAVYGSEFRARGLRDAAAAGTPALVSRRAARCRWRRYDTGIVQGSEGHARRAVRGTLP